MAAKKKKKSEKKERTIPQVAASMTFATSAKMIAGAKAFQAKAGKGVEYWQKVQREIQNGVAGKTRTKGKPKKK